MSVAHTSDSIMTPELYQRVRRLFDEAVKRPEPDGLAFVETASAADPEAARLAIGMLRAHSEHDNFLFNEPSGERRVGPYVRTDQKLGSGAMGDVWVAIGDNPHRLVALKIVRQDSSADTQTIQLRRDRLRREADIAGNLSHRGIVTIYQADETDGTAWIAMEWVRGPSLRKVLESGKPLQRDRALDILHQIAAALDYAHGKGVVHRDVKPANILIEDEKTVKIADFGIAKVFTANDQSRTFGMGTPIYMSPEQFEGGPIDGRADQFSLAVIAFEMLTGTKPFAPDSQEGALKSILNGTRPSAHARNQALPARVDSIFFRALNRKRDRRFDSCMEFVESLASALGMALVSAPNHAARAGRIRPPRSFTVIASIGAILSLGVLVWKAVPSFVNRPLGLHSVLASAEHATNSSESATSPDSAALFTQAVTDLHRGRLNLALGSFIQAANAGDANSMVELGDLYSAGVVVPLNNGEALRWYRKAAEAGDSRGMLHLGGMYSLGLGMSQDYREAARWFQAAADEGEPSAMFDLGWQYEHGEGVPQNLDTAARLYRQAAALGNNEAKRRLADWAQR